MDSVGVYYLSREGTDRDNRMQERFNKLNVIAQRVEWVSHEWLKEKGYYSYAAASCQFGHLKMLKCFVESKHEYACILEDDVYLKKSFTDDVTTLLNKIKQLNLDILLIGYLLNYKPYTENDHHKIIDTNMILRFPDDLWGSQGYLITRKHALYLINKYNENYLDRILAGENLTPFSADWTLTKDGNRAIVCPMLAVEEGIIASNHQGQINFHRSCTEFNYKPDEYV